MKKFLFTLAALLMALTTFAQTDAKYLYVNTALCEDLGINPATGDHEILLVISAEFPAYLNAFEAEILAPEGMIIDMVEPGPDAVITYYNARGTQQTFTPSISVGSSNEDASHFIIANMQSGYDYVDGVLTDIITVKWGPGYHEEFLYAYAIIDDDVYNGGDIPIITKPASGRDPRTTITDLDDSQVPHETPATEPLPDPTPDVVAPAAPVITFSGEDTAEMTVTVTAEEGCTLIVNGEGILSNTYTYTVTRDDIYTPGTVNVTAKAVKDGVESDEATDSKDFIVADFPTADQPVIEFVETKNENNEVVSVEVVVTNATDYTITVDGVETDATVINANYTAAQAIHVEAVNDPGYPYEENSNEADYNLNKLAKKAVAAPVITTSMDDNNVYVNIAWPAETDGNQIYTGEYTYARPEYGQPAESYDVEAYVEEGSEWLPSGVTTTTIEVPAKAPVWQDVAAPVISYTMDDNNVYVTITWPETTGNQIYTGEYTYARPEYGEADQSYAVEAYTEADYPYSESVHATQTIPVPAKEPVWEDVAAPVISYEVVGDQVVVTIQWPETTGNHVYTGEYTYDRPAAGEETAMYDVEAYTEADYPYKESAHAYLTIFVPALEPDQTPAPTITYADNGEGILVTVTGEGNIVFYVEDEKVAEGESPLTYLLPYSEFAEGEMVTVSATAQAAGETVSAYAIEEIFVPHKQPAYVAAPVIETTMDADYVYVTITWPTTDGEHFYNGQMSYPRTDADYTVDVEAYTGATPNYLESVHATKTIEVPAKEVVELMTFVKVTSLDQLVAGKKVIFVCDDYAMGEIVNGFGQQVEVTPVRAEGEVMAPSNIAFTLGGETGAWTFERNDDFLRQAGNNTNLQMGDEGNAAMWNVNNNNGDLDGFRARGVQYDNRSVKMHNSMNRFGNYANGDAQSTFAFLYIEKEDAPVLDPVADPDINVETGKYNEAIVTITCDEEDATIYYRYQFDDETWSDWAVYDGPITFVDNGHYNFEAYAEADGMADSNVVDEEFVVSNCTAVNEINGGKAIAGVRYFNLAGQEMAQPEGMTIIVTTYTDGTTSAVKVMK